MPSLADHHSSQFAKLLYIGDSGTGKTGSLVSLIRAGYHLRILDLDNGLDALVHHARQEQLDLSLVEYETRRDVYKGSPLGPVLKTSPKAFVDSMKLLDKWTDDSTPAEWGEQYVLILDSLTALGLAAFEWAKGMNPSAKDPRQWYFTAQEAVERVIINLFSEEFHANVIVISHVNYIEFHTGITKGYPTTIGKALSTKIAKHVNTLIMAETMGKTRKIRTVPTGIVDLKTPNPFQIDGELPLNEGVADVFRLLKGAE